VETLDLNGNPVSTVGEYEYDGDGKRVKKHVPSTGEVTVFVYDAGGKLIGEYSTVAAPQSPKVSYTTADHLGSPRILTDQNGATISRRDFMPYGEEITRSAYGQDSVREKFATYERDGETDLDYAQARMYAKTHGRFTGPDPFNIVLETRSALDAKEASDGFMKYLLMPTKWNRYAYVLNNPIALVDPHGLDALIVVFIDYKIAVGSGGKSGRVPYLGHAGIVLIDEDGTATYFEYGRYDKENKGEVRNNQTAEACIILPKLEFTSDGVATKESVEALMKALSEHFGQKGGVEGAYFNTNQETTDKMKAFALGELAKNSDPNREPYALFSKNCMTFTREVLAGGGVELNTQNATPRPVLDISYINAGKYTVPGESRNTRNKPGRIPYRPEK